MDVRNYVTNLGIEKLMEICNNNLQCALEHMKRVCGKVSNRYRKKCEKFLNEKYNCPNTDLKTELIQILRKEFNYDR